MVLESREWRINGSDEKLWLTIVPASGKKLKSSRQPQATEWAFRPNLGRSRPPTLPGCTSKKGTLEKARAAFSASGLRRGFLAENEVLRLGEGVVVS